MKRSKKTKSSAPVAQPSASPLAERCSGVLLHPTSLPGPYGIGDIGPAAEKFLDFLVESKQRLWMTLPTSPTSTGGFHCPYSSYSAFAGNPLLISPDKVHDAGLCSRKDLIELASRASSKNTVRVDLRKAEREKARFLQGVFQRNQSEASVRGGVEEFRSSHPWAEDFALFAALRRIQGKPRSLWSPELRVKDKKTAPKLIKLYQDQINFEVFCQWIFFEQLKALKQQANAKGVYFFGDLPIYVSDDSADVWASPKYFLLDKEKRPTLVSGVPPDAFSKDGQLWGHPIYDWAALKRDGFAWWVERMRTALELADVVRIDHFRGLASFYAVPAGAKTAAKGTWKKCPGDGLLEAFRSNLGSVPVVAEDLGFITDDVHELRDKFNLLGMRVLQFGFGQEGYSTNIHAPFNVSPQSAIFTGTHDNDTSTSWIKSVPAEERKRILDILGKPSPSDFSKSFIRLAMSTPARVAITPLQDLLSLGASARMNRPGQARWDNWSWRYDTSLKPIAKWLAELTVATGRAVGE